MRCCYTRTTRRAALRLQRRPMHIGCRRRILCLDGYQIHTVRRGLGSLSQWRWMTGHPRPCPPGATPTGWACGTPGLSSSSSIPSSGTRCLPVSLVTQSGSHRASLQVLVAAGCTIPSAHACASALPAVSNCTAEELNSLGLPGSQCGNRTAGR